MIFPPQVKFPFSITRPLFLILVIGVGLGCSGSSSEESDDDDDDDDDTPSASQCEDACEHVYDECGFVLVDSDGSDLSQSECEETCPDQTTTLIDCLEDVTCTEAAINACLEGTDEDECDSNLDCATGEECSNGTCVALDECGSNNDCDTDETCINGYCYADTDDDDDDDDANLCGGEACASGCCPSGVVCCGGAFCGGDCTYTPCCL